MGKSSLLAAASAAKPEIADYPFTTREPILGVVEIGAKSFTLAEIPGLIAGAHLGRGLGHDFLRHALRTRVFIHLVDGTSSSPVEDMVQVNNELNLFDRALAEKPQLVAVNKIDIPEVQARLTEIKDAFWEAGIDAVFVSAVTKQGVPELMLEALRLLERVTPSQKAVREEPVKVFRPQPRGGGIKVRKEGEEFVLEAPNIERMMQGLDLENSEVRYMIERQLSRPGVKQALVRAGVKMGDKVRCGKFEWLWSGK